jgi:YVTN family beta-propeller protein
MTKFISNNRLGVPAHLRKFLFGLASWLAVGLATGAAQVAAPPAASHVELPGLRPDGSVLLPNQWSLRPVGRQVDVGDFPVNIAVHPDGRFAAVLHSGFGKHEIVIVDIHGSKVFSRKPVHQTFYGIEFSSNGKRLYCSGGADEVIHVFDFKDGELTAAGPPLHLRDARERGVPCGLAISKDDRLLFAANVWGQTVSEMNVTARTNIAEFVFTADATNDEPAFTNQAPVNFDLEAITKRMKATLDPVKPDAPFPYACRLDEPRRRLYVSLWAKSCVAVVDLTTRKVIAEWPTGEHPNEMTLTKSRRYLFVANANRNTVTVLDTSTGQAVETLDASISATSLPGSVPESLALSPDETKLFVANACNNNVAVFDVSTIGKSHSLGFIPVGWYPTSVRVTPDGKHLLVANGKGLISRADPGGPEPGRKNYAVKETIKDLFPGTLSIIDLPKGKEFETELAAYTRQAFECSPQPALSPAADNPIPPKPGEAGPLKYCIYVIKENRTYDQVLGDMKEGNGDPDLCLFPEKVTPNLHKIARDFVLLDNFYVDAEVSADGHEWSMGAIATDFVEKTWPLNYGHNRSGKFPYPSEGGFPIAFPANGYLWDRAREMGVTYRSYGEFIMGTKSTNEPAYPRVASLKGHFDPWYHHFDLGYPDVKRADRFISELKRFETEGDMPRLQIVRLGNDHTSGTLVGARTPTACVADNDLGVGMLVDAVSHSKFWPQTAIFILEDDAQDGPDHVDAHRSPAFIVSPYTRRHVVDSTMYSTSSMLRTMELILGLKPMTQYDAAAEPMFNAFEAKADLTPYETLPAQIDLKERNGAKAWGAAISRKMDFSKEDATDEQQLNEVVWHSVRGPNQPMPAPVHAAFVFAHAKDDDDD